MPSIQHLPRIRHLDVLRGIALLGILPVNAAFFAFPVAEADAVADVSSGVSAVVVDAVVMLLFEQKFITLFSFLFGAGIALMHEGAESRGDAYVPMMLRRLSVFWVIGVLHALLLWHGDIVSIYAPLGLLLFWAVGLRPRTLALLGCIGLVLPLPLLTLFEYAAAMPAETAHATPVLTSVSPDTPWAPFLRACAEAIDGNAPEFETSVFSGGTYVQTCVLRTSYWLMALVYVGLTWAWRIGGLFLLGMAAVRAGWLRDPGRHRRIFGAMAVVGFSVGLPLEGCATWLTFRTEGAAAAAATEVAHYTGGLVLAAGYLGAVALVVEWASRSRILSQLLAPFDAVGRTAFSNYLLQSVLMDLVFCGFGLGLFGSLSTQDVAGVVIGVWLVQVAVTLAWLRLFARGPVEWFTRRLTHLRPIPMRRGRMRSDPRGRG